MTQRAKLTIFFCTATLLTAQAQLNKQDSIRLQQFLQGGNDIQINSDAVKAIEFNFTPKKEEWKGTPLVSEEKPWMRFLDELPKNFGDTTKWRKPKFIRLTPYTPYTKWYEDPVNDPIFAIVDTMKIGKWILNIKPTLGIRNGFRVLPAGMDQSVTPSNNPLGTFDADKALFETLTKRGRAIRRNREKAVAWKTYRDYLPTSKDTEAKDLLILQNDSSKTKNEPISSRNDSLLVPIDSIHREKESLFLKNEVDSQN
ncbi:MAG: DUF4858 domain-containing protein [Phocaeicola sp.]